MRFQSAIVACADADREQLCRRDPSPAEAPRSGPPEAWRFPSACPEPSRQASPIARPWRPYLNRGEGICASFVPMRVVTWNVNSLKVRMPRVLELLEQHQPDVALPAGDQVQPRRVPRAGAAGGRLRGRARVRRALGGRRDPGPDRRHRGAAGRCRDAHEGARPGAQVGRQPHDARPVLTDPHAGLPGDPVPDEARWIEATAGEIRFASVYVPNGRTLDSPEYPRKLAFLEAMAQRIAELQQAGAADRLRRHEHRPGRRRRL